MARPVTYLSWQVKSRDGAQHDVMLYLDVDGSIATNTSGEKVVWSRDRIGGLDLLRIGTQKQAMLEEYGDDLRINWGYFYIGVPDGQGKTTTTAGNWSDRRSFLESGKIPTQDDLEQPRMPKSQHPASPKLIVAMPLGLVGNAPVSRRVLLSYNDVYSVEYLRQRLLPYWRKQFLTFGEMLEAAEVEYGALTKRAEQFDAELEHDLVQEGGAEYCSDRHPRIPPGDWRSQIGGRRCRRALLHAEREFQQWINIHGRCAVPVGAHVPFAESEASRGAA